MAQVPVLVSTPKDIRMLLAIVFIDMCCTSCDFVRTPARVLELGGSAQTYGLLTGAMGSLQLAAGPILGKFCDRGPEERRLALVLGLVASSATSAAGGWATSLPAFVLSRCPAALLAHTATHARLSVADISKRDGSAVTTGRFAHINSVMGLGLSAGSLVGGWLSYEAGAMVCAASYAVASLLVALAHPAATGQGRALHSTPHTTPSVRRRRSRRSRSPEQINPHLRALKPVTMAVLCSMRLFFSLAAVAQRETFALSLRNLGTPIGGVGMLLSYKGVVTMLVNSAALAPLLRRGRYSEHFILQCSVAGQVLSYCGMGAALAATSIGGLALVQLPLTGACGYNRPRAHQYVGKSQSCMV